MHGSFEKGNIAWFLNGKINTCYNCIDRHVFEYKNGDDVAIIWEGDEPTQTRHITFQQLLDKVCQIANAFKASGVKKGDVVTLYMPMIPECLMTMLACARIGAVHSVIFAGFSSDAIAERVECAQSKFVVTADGGLRGGRNLPLKKICDTALAKDGCKALVEKVFVFKHAGGPGEWVEGRDIKFDEMIADQRPYCPCVSYEYVLNIILLLRSSLIIFCKSISFTGMDGFRRQSFHSLHIWFHRPTKRSPSYHSWIYPFCNAHNSHFFRSEERT